ncbi:MAG: hypothetical protein BWX55_00986 [Deltaproteobacteria bacterium ADurb.Bin022]|nr:MAG: hypothetical protein BWX55_00986 [Deltaproteobacteria bacterium ADurb.Bin022]
MEADVQSTSMYYSEHLLQSWRNGDYSMLMSSDASDYIKKIIAAKTKIRQGRRFFGEAFIASNIKMRDGWYNSFKWLTDPIWITGDGLKNEFQRLFHGALLKHIGLESLASLQNNVLLYYQEHEGELKHKKPVAPDLWVIEPSGHFIFIEAKLPGDSPKPQQLAGLMLIKKYLKVLVPVTVKIINLLPTSASKAKKKPIHSNIVCGDVSVSSRKVMRIGDVVKGKDLRPAEGDLISKGGAVHIFYGGQICRTSMIDGTAKRGERLWKKEGECPYPKKYRETVTGLGLTLCSDCLDRFNRE